MLGVTSVFALRENGVVLTWIGGGHRVAGYSSPPPLSPRRERRIKFSLEKRG